MDIGAMSMAISSSSLMQNVNLAVTKMSMDNATSGQVTLINDMLKSQMELSVNPSVGSNIDIKL